MVINCRFANAKHQNQATNSVYFVWSQLDCSIKPHCSCKQTSWLRVHRGKELIQLVSEESSFFNHIIAAEWPPGFSSGAVQGSAKAEAELCLGSEQRRMTGTVKVLKTGWTQTHWSHQFVQCNQRWGRTFTLKMGLLIELTSIFRFVDVGGW